MGNPLMNASSSRLLTLSVQPNWRVGAALVLSLACEKLAVWKKPWTIRAERMTANR